MKNTEMLDYLRNAEKAAYDDMMKPRIGEFAYEYHRGKYDAIAHARMELTDGLELGAKAMNFDLDAFIGELWRIRKWTIVPRNRRGLDDIIADLTKMREPIND